MISQRSALVAATAIVAVSLGASGGAARAAGGYAGIDGTSGPVPTPTYRMFSGQPYYGLSPASSYYNRNGVIPNVPPLRQRVPPPTQPRR